MPPERAARRALVRPAVGPEQRVGHALPRALCSAFHIAGFWEDATLKRIQVEGSWVGEKRLPGAAR
jgi:hypothetical protein